MARKPSSKNDDPVRAEQRRLQEMQAELARKQDKLRKMLDDAPKRIEQQRRRHRESIRLNVAAAPAMRATGLRDKRHSDPSPTRRRTTLRKSERNAARIKFLFLCLILFSIFFWVWQAIPR
jgi:hypothetical protein